VRSLDVQCHQCRHRVIINVEHLSGNVTVLSLGRRMVCTRCGTSGADVRPNWQERPERENLTGKQLPDK
jgi:DNA-directed RNA polymerase subunit RPC12/RpoP